ncbi:MAG: hypothetical protein Q8Q40_13645 [Methylococcaceae bacterium]|nr:hypothetical protein [Methylococcaceae bacterium]MDP3905002.1 hypothetical protein [Methylococcaceae bacterium]
MTTSNEKNAQPSLSEGYSQNQSSVEYQHCPACNSLADYPLHPLYNPDPLKTFLICHSCGHKNGDVAIFYIVNSNTTHQEIASPSFPTEAEAKRFAEILSLKKSDGYQLKHGIAEFNGEHDQQARLDLIHHLAWGRNVLSWLVELRPEQTSDEELRIIANALKLNGYSLPIFRDQILIEGI